MATIIAAHDLSGAGRCSLTTALAVLPSFGHTCYPLPTAVLSQQTGFPGYSFLDFTPQMPAYLNGWRELGISADLIYTGFLGNGEQAALLSEFISEFPDALCVVDPVMGDNAEIYSCYDEDFVRDMRTLARSAHILIPNMTEFLLLGGISEAQTFPQSSGEILSLALEIDAPRLNYIIITSANGKHGMCNVIVDMKAKTADEIPYRSNGIAYSGAGDLFASAVCALLGGGMDVSEAVRRSADFVEDAADATPRDADPRFGIQYERLLCRFAIEGGSKIGQS